MDTPLCERVFYFVAGGGLDMREGVHPCTYFKNSKNIKTEWLHSKYAYIKGIFPVEITSGSFRQIKDFFSEV